LEEKEIAMQRIRYYFLATVIFFSSLALHSIGIAAPIHEAAVNGDVELLEILIANGADVDVRDVNGYTPLHLAIHEGNTEVAKVLINNGADVNARTIGDNGNGLSPLYLSIILGRSAVESLLLDNRAER
jgi:ankyrin repeat protein